MSIGTILLIILGWGTGHRDCHPFDPGFARQNLNGPKFSPLVSANLDHRTQFALAEAACTVLQGVVLGNVSLDRARKPKLTRIFVPTQIERGHPWRRWSERTSSTGVDPR